MTDTLASIDERMASLTAPVPGPKPAGDDLSFDPEFDTIKFEIDKPGTATSEPQNWQQIITSSERLLTRTKDLRLATWWSVAKMNRSGWSGLAEGLTLFRALTDRYWDGLHPERRPRARANLFLWLTEQVTTFLAARTVTPADADAIQACETLFMAIDATLAEKLGELHPGLGTVRSFIAGRLATLAAESHVVAPLPVASTSETSTSETSSPETSSPNASSAAVVPGSPFAGPSATPVRATSPGDVNDVLTASRDAILSAAAHLREQEPSEPWAYHLQRVGAWLLVRAAPPAEGTKTFVPAPLPRIRQDLEGHVSRSRWEPLLKEAEGLTSAYLFWIDLHRYVVLALRGLGWTSSADGVTREVSTFVARFPLLLTYCFSDGSPFASPATQTWIEESSSKPSGSAGDASSSVDAHTHEQIEQARQAASGGRVGEGVGLVLSLARRSAEGRTRFRLELDAARLALSVDNARLARAILQGLMTRIEVHDLETWDPALCVEVYVVMLSAIRTSNVRLVVEENTEAVIMEKLGRLDPTLAVRMGL